VIVRIFSEGQYRLADSDAARVHELEQEYIDSVDSGDEAVFRTKFDALLTYVRDVGELLAADELEPSALILPPADITLDEARAEFTGDGLIPD
jgi:hypothetical protein